MSVCPVCNGTQKLNRKCKACQCQMEDAGQIENYYGPYSPYQEQATLNTLPPESGPSSCMHLCRCPDCGCEEKVPVQIRD